MIDRSRDDIAASVTVRSECAREIDPVHEASAEQRSQRVGVVGQHNLDHVRDGVFDGSGCKGDIVLFHSPLGAQPQPCVLDSCRTRARMPFKMAMHERLG